MSNCPAILVLPDVEFTTIFLFPTVKLPDKSKYPLTIVSPVAA